MSGSQQRPSDAQDKSTPLAPADRQGPPLNPQYAYQPPSYMPQQAQFAQQGNVDLMRMSSLQSALPNVHQPAHAQGHQYSAISHAAPYPMQVQGQPSAYHGYPQCPTRPGGPQYQEFIEQGGHTVQYNTTPAQYVGQSVYAGPQVQQYVLYPPDYGQTSPMQQGSFQGTPRGYSSAEYAHSALAPGQPTAVQGRAGYSPGSIPSSRSPPVPAVPRGPPRKPKQSGHALWVGNLPPHARVVDVKDHFAREATKDIESVFLISKSNCAFVNYRTEEACAAAMARFNDSRFQGAKLVCRLRRTGGSPLSPGLGPPSPLPSSPAAQQQVVPTQTQTAVEAIAQNRELSQKATDITQPGGTKVNDKYFIVKSLTVEDLELSVRNGTWATQGHNEEVLNKAYETVENVYLIFSANKSGEYFGYARMDSAIDDDTSKILEWQQHRAAPRTEELIADPDLPRSIPTPATEWAPKGRIVDDSARGTIFWEVEPADVDDPEPRETLVDGEIGAGGAPKTDDSEEEDDDNDDEQEQESTGREKRLGPSSSDPTVASGEEEGPNTFGRPFRVQWISTTRLPFYRTRGLRNAWNTNREVKIARDGTELETSVGRRLVALFQRPMIPAMPMQQGQFITPVAGPMGYGAPQYPTGPQGYY